MSTFIFPHSQIRKPKANSNPNLIRTVKASSKSLKPCVLAIRNNHQTINQSSRHLLLTAEEIPYRGGAKIQKKQQLNRIIS
jgi:hypothetical protein